MLNFLRSCLRGPILGENDLLRQHLATFWRKKSASKVALKYPKLPFRVQLIISLVTFSLFSVPEKVQTSSKQKVLNMV